MDLAAVKRAMLAKLAESGLGPEEVKKLGFKPYTADNDLGLPLQAPGFVIPYFTLDGKQNCHFRYRLLGEPTVTGFASAAAKVPKYLQKTGSETGVYFSPLCDWDAVLNTPGEDGKPQIIFITEGELKADCACKMRFPTIGLGGVWSFMNKKRGQSLLPILEGLPWAGRVVNIIFDSDAVTNPQVVKAENTLARQLLKRGALPSVVRLPGTGTAKVGLDDYLMANPLDDFMQLVNDAPLWGTSQELHELNEEVTYVRDPGLILRLENLQKMSPGDFKAHQYSNRTVMVAEPTDKNPNKVVEKSAPHEWLKWPSRSEVEAITYAPGEGLYVDNKINTWPGWGVEPAKGDITPWKKLLDYMFKGLPVERRYFEQWCACPLQNPGIKMFVAVVMWGVTQGTGKSLVGYTMQKIYGRNFVELDNAALGNQQWTAWAENKQFTLGDEVTAGEKRGLATQIKNMITRRQLRINIKHVAEFYVPDCINYYFTSNLPDAFFMDDQDRRLFVNEVKGDPLPREFYKGEYEPWLASEAGPAALFHHLLTLDMTGFDPHAPALSTAAKAEMRVMSRSALGSWIRELKDTPDNVLRMGAQVNTWAYATTKDLLDIYDPAGKTGTSVTRMGIELKSADFKQMNDGKQIRLSDGRKVILWEVRRPENRATKPTSTWLAKNYEKNNSRKY